MYTPEGIAYKAKGRGLRESFSSCLRDGNKVEVSLICGLDFGLNPVAPFVYKEGEFAPMVEEYSLVEGEKDVNAFIDVFMRSHRTIYSPVRGSFLVCDLKGTLDLESAVWGDVELNLRVSKTMQDWGNGEEVLICDNLETEAGLNTVVVPASYYKEMKNTVLDNLKDKVTSKRDFLIARLSKALDN